ncbi:Peptide ABC transporter, ATP-binding protein [Desulfonema limicola]|uniref:Peptide ABC transporter, ATP-binding protein n=1 Tax=Desulfonema limicola TaxID=45656 RepID=A0A975B4T1_9BACT|nr:Peptide ABC transporter, ATP-binding protein [Desulfonema limicola]
MKGLKTCFKQKDKSIIRAVDGVDIEIAPGEVHGLVGESGCGKSVLSLSILRLISPPGFISGGEIVWEGNDLLRLDNNDMRKIRGKEIAMIFQNPQASLNPLYTVSQQMTAVIRLHRKISKKEAKEEAVRLLKMVQLPDAEKRMKSYPHELSGGMCQRVMIAMAISLQPKMIIADEPTSSLDVTIGAQILNLLIELRRQFNISILLISHDMGAVSRICSKISVMYLGRILETGNKTDIFQNPQHPYTQALLDAGKIPVHSHPAKSENNLIKGDIPGSMDIPSGCRFHTRCPSVFEKCYNMEPELKTLTANGIKVACHLYE